ncbi:TRAP transporter substrate-binding protein [Mobilicoccus massiliensis]|uniref:TRAP transporter substrate-binding protein n=1 Tax=Mobilicoccus massiliensis TaxID=1522310 RepID=UPI001FE9D1B6|nr:TRAP transporter substrate-binding protein [Mobilicoccus massiliensis]
MSGANSWQQLARQGESGQAEPSPAFVRASPDREDRQNMRATVLTAAAVGGALMVSLAACGSPQATGAGADAPVTLRLALNQTKEHPSYVALSGFDQRLREATGGRYRIDVFPNEVLGAQQEILGLTGDGIIDLAVISGTQLENIDQDFRVFNLPRVFDSVAHQSKVINDPKIVGDLYTSLEASKHLTVLGGFTQGERSLYTKKPVNTPADLAGKKIRVQESPVMLRMVTTMGGSPTPMSYGEVYTAMQAGVLDGAENNEVSYFTQKHYEVAPHFTYTRHLVGLDYIVANTESLQKMAPADRAIFDREWTKTHQEFVVLWDKATKDAITGATAAGAQFHEIDTKPFDERLEKMSESFLQNDNQRQLYRQAREAATS